MTLHDKHGSFICLAPAGSVFSSRYGFRHPMYLDVSEVVDLIKLTLRETTGKNIASVRAVESGIVEEHAVIEKHEAGKRLIFRVWPVFFTHNKRIDYKIYEEDRNIREAITDYLGVCAKTNNARLAPKA